MVAYIDHNTMRYLVEHIRNDRPLLLLLHTLDTIPSLTTILNVEMSNMQSDHLSLIRLCLHNNGPNRLHIFALGTDEISIA